MNKIAFLIVALIAGFLGGLTTYWLLPPQQITYIQNPNSTNSYNTSYLQAESSNEHQEDFSQASAIGTPSVVFIQCESTTTNYGANMFDWIFGGGANTNQVASSGSGVIYSGDGYIVTNHHVINNADKIEVVINKRNYPASVVGKDPNTDLAVLKINEKNLPYLKIGSSKNLKVGEWVLAIGNPFNLYSTATAGIVSAKARNLNIVHSQFPIESFIQTDAAINPGNSGGALVNIKGELIGVNTAILSRTGSYSGYGFAVPIDIVKKVVNDIITYGEVQKAFGGLEVSEISSALADKLKIKDYNGVIVNYLQKDGAAEKSGLKKGDIIIKINDQNIEGKSSYDELMSYLNPGEKIKITYKSNEVINEASLILTNSEGTTEIIKRSSVVSSSLASELESVSKVEKDKRGISSGVRLIRIKAGIFAQLGIKEGFIITSINRYPTNTPEEVIEILEKIRGKVIIDGVDINNMRTQRSFVLN
ncbi:MAG: PDZ domain-containing protein [Cytophagales bacterium]|nr:MAG: PDZ domain-containing protein [Cytophagales bacterium]